MKPITIIRTSGNELANQLWNYISVYAYSFECNRRLVNPAFFEYGEYFTMKAAPGFVFKLLFFKPFKDYTKRKTSLKRRIWRKIYTWYSTLIMWMHKKQTISLQTETLYLPPTSKISSATKDGKVLNILKNNSSLHLDGWLFRNPVGLEKYRIEIQEYFKPRADILNEVQSYMGDLRNKFEKVIGVHIRQSDYKTWKNGVYFIEQTRVRTIIDDYISLFKINHETTCFFIASDGKIDTALFKGLNIDVSKHNAVTDLFLLASTDAIIGSNSTFGAFASYYGNIPHIVMQKERMDWEYYKDKKTYFENKYSTHVNY